MLIFFILASTDILSISPYQYLCDLLETLIISHATSLPRGHDFTQCRLKPLFISKHVYCLSMQVMTTSDTAVDKDQIIETIAKAPSVLTVDDVDDFCQLASYFSEKTPSSFKRELAGCFYSGTMVASATKVDAVAAELPQAFCLKVCSLSSCCSPSCCKQRRI